MLRGISSCNSSISWFSGRVCGMQSKCGNEWDSVPPSITGTQRQRRCTVCWWLCTKGLSTVANTRSPEWSNNNLSGWKACLQATLVDVVSPIVGKTKIWSQVANVLTIMYCWCWKYHLGFCCWTEGTWQLFVLKSNTVEQGSNTDVRWSLFSRQCIWFQPNLSTDSLWLCVGESYVGLCQW